MTEGYKLITEAAKLAPPSLLVAMDPHQNLMEKKIGEIGRLLEYAANQLYNSARAGTVYICSLLMSPNHILGKLDELVEAAQNIAKFTLQLYAFF